MRSRNNGRLQCLSLSQTHTLSLSLLFFQGIKKALCHRQMHSRQKLSAIPSETVGKATRTFISRRLRCFKAGIIKIIKNAVYNVLR